MTETQVTVYWQLCISSFYNYVYPFTPSCSSRMFLRTHMMTKLVFTTVSQHLNCTSAPRVSNGPSFVFVPDLRWINMLDTLLSLSIRELIGGGNGIFCSTSHMASSFNVASSFFSRLGGMSQRLSARRSAEEISLPVLVEMCAINLACGSWLYLDVFIVYIFKSAHSK